MILTCPQCSARFQLADEVLGPEGKKVRCSECHAVWFQMPDDGEGEDSGAPDDGAFAGGHDEIEGKPPPPPPPPPPVLPDIAPPAEEVPGHRLKDDDFKIKTALLTDIPKGVQPTDDSDLDLVMVERKKGLGALLGFFTDPIAPKAKRNGYLAALVLVGGVTGGLIVMKDAVFQAYPPSIRFYEMLGMEIEVPGAGLIFDEIATEIMDGKIKVSGQIMNLRGQERALAPVLISVHAQDHSILEQWIVALPEESVPPGMILPFSSAYESEKLEGAVEVGVEFVLGRSEIKAPEPASVPAEAEEGHATETPAQEEHHSGGHH